MTSPAIRVERLGKSYLVGHRDEARYLALRDVLAGGARRLARSAADMLAGRPLVPGDRREEFRALSEVSFSIASGERVGVIGRNGAGKSTLLKLLARITEPSEGRIELRGRLASLLEVGAGFHPELTGRENIFLNGAVLGMRRAEIRARFDEIVAFAEIERFLDTPVKRYSSGMYVRLAFAVAAHLQPDILVVDEVLAVGDAEFQRKCLGRMHDASRSGRAVLFVSHNLAAIRSLTDRVLWLDAGRLAFDGPTEAGVDAYLAATAAPTEDAGRPIAGRGRHTRILRVRLVDSAGAPTSIWPQDAPLVVEVEFETDGARGLSLDLFLHDHGRAPVGLASTHHFHEVALPAAAGRYRCRLALAPVHLAAGAYGFDIATSLVNHGWDHMVEDALRLERPTCNPGVGAWNFQQSYGYGTLALPFATPPAFAALAGAGVASDMGRA